MADLDPELLALAGDESSDDEGSVVSQRKSRSLTPDSVHKQRDSESPDAPRRGKGRTVRRNARSERKEESEEGEASSAESLRSASMSESESDDDSDAGSGDEGPLFPYEKLFTSAKEKSEIMALPEIEREEILAERNSQLDRHKQDKLLRKLLATRDAGDSKTADKKKRKASAADLEDSKRKSSRQKTVLGGRKVGEASDAIEAYKRKREQKGKRDEDRRNNASLNKSANRRRDSYSPEESDAGSADDEYDYDSRKRAPKKSQNLEDDLPAEIRDLNRAIVGRSNFGQYCFYPTFDKAVRGCYARVCIGPSKENPRENEYRICQIKSIVDGKPYAIEAQNGRSYVTTQYGLMAHGKAEKEFPFIQVSNTKFTEREFQRYRTTMIVENMEMPTKGYIKDRVAALNALINYQFSADELEKKLQKQGAMAHKDIMIKKATYENQLANAIAENDEEKIAEAERRLAELKAPKLAFGTKIVKAAAADDKHARIAELNRRNQKLNAENVRKAQIEELRQERKTAALVARGEAKANPFARVKTIAKTHHDALDSMPSSQDMVSDLFEDLSAPPSGVATPLGATSTSNVTIKKIEPKDPAKETFKIGSTKIVHKSLDDDLAAAIDFEIDIEM